MSFMDTLKNPVVIVGGVGLGVLLMVMGKSGQPSNNSGSAVPGYTSATQMYNANAMRMQETQVNAWASVQKSFLSADSDIKKANIGANKDIGIATIGANVQRDIATLSFLNNMSNNAAQVAKQNVISNQGITQAAIQASSAVTIDQLNNMARISLANVAAPIAVQASKDNLAGRISDNNAKAQVAAITSNAQVEAARYQYKAIKKASNNNLLGTIAHDVIGVAKAALI